MVRGNGGEKELCGARCWTEALVEENSQPNPTGGSLGTLGWLQAQGPWFANPLVSNDWNRFLKLIIQMLGYKFRK